jgi:hypothetical protein
MEITQFLRIFHKSNYENDEIQTRFVAIFQRLFRPVLEKDNNYFYCPSSMEITTSSGGGGGGGGEKEDDMTSAVVLNGEHILVETTASLDDERDNSPLLEVPYIPSLTVTLTVTLTLSFCF